MGDNKSFTTTMNHNKAVIALVMGILSLIIPVTTFLAVFLIMMNPLLIWVLFIMGIGGLVFGIIDYRKTKKRNREEDGTLVHNQFISPFMMMGVSITVLVTSFALMFFIAAFWLLPFIGVVLAIFAFVLGVIELHRIKRSNEEENNENSKKYAKYGVISSIVSILLHIVFVILFLVLVLAAVNLLVEWMTDFLSNFN